MYFYSEGSGAPRSYMTRFTYLGNDKIVELVNLIMGYLRSILPLIKCDWLPRSRFYLSLTLYLDILNVLILS